MPELPRTPAAIADLLGETEPHPRQQLTWIAKRLGPRGMAVLVEAVLAIETQGGIVLPSGYRRTPGGVLFWLVKTGWKPPIVPSVPLAQALQTIPTDLRKGGATVKIILTGRPTETADLGEYVALLMESHAPQSVPKGLPTPPSEGVRWMVLIAAKQWQAVASALRRDKEDILVIEGQPSQVDATLVLYATQVVTKGQQRAKQARQRAASLAKA
jgi:hypothetical protein